METNTKEYVPTIGIEVHAELKTTTKMFCGCANDPHNSEPNVHTCPVCMAHPGTLPVINKQAVAHVLTVGAALGSELAGYTEFDRKNYFYPDIPKGYQISQYLYPLVKGGSLKGVAITRVHLEEDTARSQHESSSGSLVDYNRAGVPLMELVTEPVIHDARTAGNFARELQLLLRTLGVSDANMERGEMRVEANISVSKTSAFGTKVEVKNLNSFKSVEMAIAYEVKRQVALLEEGGSVVQETRGWDEVKGKTFSQRLKESADDYRYFPDPDLPKLHVDSVKEYSLSRIVDLLPELPEKKRAKYNNLGLSIEQTEVIISDTSMTNYFESVILALGSDTKLARMAANYITSDVRALTELGRQLLPHSASSFSILMRMVDSGEITSRVAKDLLPEVVFDCVDPSFVVKERGLVQNNSSDSLLEVVRDVLKTHVSVADDYRSGKESSIQFLVGQCMKVTKGSGNPTVLKELLEKELKQ